MKIIWNKENISLLGKDFLSKVKSKMGKEGKVQFGQTGNGTRPNYQIIDGQEISTFRGSNHKTYKHPKPFDPKNLSKEFCSDDIERAIAAACNHSKKEVVF